MVIVVESVPINKQVSLHPVNPPERDRVFQQFVTLMNKSSSGADKVVSVT